MFCSFLHYVAGTRGSAPLSTNASVEIRPIDERIEELCHKALTADDSEVKTLLEELQALLAEHSEASRYLAAKTLKR